MLRRIEVSADEVRAFRAKWPCSGLPRGVGFVATYSGKELVGVEWMDGQDYWDAETSGALMTLALDAGAGAAGHLVS